MKYSSENDDAAEKKAPMQSMDRHKERERRGAEWQAFIFRTLAMLCDERIVFRKR